MDVATGVLEVVSAEGQFLITEGMEEGVHTD